MTTFVHLLTQSGDVYINPNQVTHVTAEDAGGNKAHRVHLADGTNWLFNEPDIRALLSKIQNAM